MARSEKDLIIGQNIKVCRKQRRLTQEQLAKSINRTISSIQKYESGETEVPRSILERIADVLDCRITELLDDFSAMNWEDNRDSAIFSLLESIGCKATWSADLDIVTIVWKGVNYSVSSIDFLGFLEDIEDSVTDTITHLIQRKGTKIPDKQ